MTVAALRDGCRVSDADHRRAAAGHVSVLGRITAAGGQVDIALSGPGSTAPLEPLRAPF